MKRSFAIIAALALSGCAFADTAYITTAGNQFGTVNLTSGAFTYLGSSDAALAGLGEVNNVLYTGIAGGTTLYTVNESNGSLTAVGSTAGSFAYFDMGSTTTGVYEIDAQGNLYSVSTKTGQASLIGSTLLPIEANYIGMSSGASNLYVTVGSALYSVNPTTAASTLIGSGSVAGFGGLAAFGNTLYGGSDLGSNASYLLNTVSGMATFQANLVGTPAPSYTYGLAPVVPEPGTLALFGLAGSLLCGFALKRKKA